MKNLIPLLSGLAMLCLTFNIQAQELQHTEGEYESVFAHFESNSLIGLSDDGLQIGLDVGYPVYQNTAGTQMKNGLLGTIGLKYTVGGTSTSCH